MSTVKYQVVKCEKCNKNFKLKPKTIKTELVAEGIERTFFKCPGCKHKFISFYKDEEFENNLSKLEDLQMKVKNISIDSKEFEDALEVYKKLSNRNIEISKLYKNIYGA